MGLLENLVLVFVAGLVTALATGLGAVPFFFVDEFSDRWNVGLWGVASGIMVTVSVLGLVTEGMTYTAGGFPSLLVVGLLAGVVLVEVSDRVLDGVDLGGDDPDWPHEDAADGTHAHTSAGTDAHATDDARAHEAEYERATDGAGGHMGGGHGHAGGGHGHDEYALEAQAFAEGDLKKLLLILGILTVHSFPEGVAVGVSFAELGATTGEGVGVLGFTVPLLAVFMTVAISIHNVPEGTAIAIPMRAMGLSNWRMVGAVVFSSLPQPVGAVIAFAFVSWAEAFLPFGFGFAAGAMVYLVATEFIPEALETGRDLPNGGRRELVSGLLLGVVAMAPVALV